MVVWTLIGALAALTITLVDSSAPNALQMAYARTAVAMRTCEATALKEVKANPSIVQGTLRLSNCSAARTVAPLPSRLPEGPPPSLARPRCTSKFMSCLRSESSVAERLAGRRQSST
jgi:hypothetical protein